MSVGPTNSAFVKTQIEDLSDQLKFARDYTRTLIEAHEAQMTLMKNEVIETKRRLAAIQRHVFPEKQKFFKVFTPGGLVVDSFSGDGYTVYSVNFCADDSKAYVMTNDKAEEILGVMGSGCYKVEIK